MIGTNQYELTWSHFEELHSNKKNIFENLCRSLFMNELCQKDAILHSDNNHPGVEVEPTLAKDKKTKISFQAKHFDNTISYKNIEKSVDLVIKNYNNELDILYLYCNKDITKTSLSYIKIEKKLADVGIKLELITGQTILDQAMNYPPILSCYFGLDYLDEKWFQENIELSLSNLGKRYNSLFNIDTDAQRYLSLFLHEESSILELNKSKRQIK